LYCATSANQTCQPSAPMTRATTPGDTTLGERIRTARKAARLTQTDLARQLGLTPQSVQQWEQDQSEPRRKRMVDLAAALGVSVTYLEHGTDWEPRAFGFTHIDRMAGATGVGGVGDPDIPTAFGSRQVA